MVMGVNAASNAPRMLTSLAQAHRRGAEIIHVNPFVESAARRTLVPHEIARMATFRSTPTSTLNVQPRICGDLAFLRGVAKAVLETAEHDPSVLDELFLARFTTGLESYRQLVARTGWDALVHHSGVPVATMRDVARRYAVAVQQRAAADGVVEVAARDVPEVGVLGGHAHDRRRAPADEDRRGVDRIRKRTTCPLHSTG